MQKPVSATILSALLLTACGGGAPAEAPAEPTAATDTAPPAATGPALDATDACAILPREKVAQAAGVAVDAATLSRVTQPTATTAGFSQCSYAFAGGGTLDFFARASPTPDNTPEAIARTKQGMIDNLGAKTADVAGLGDAAFTVEEMHQLHVFWGGRNYIYFMSMTPPTGKPIGAIEQELAKAVVG